MNICVVCSGNICRSPFVEYILKRELGERYNIYSAGTLGIYGIGAYKECVLLAPQYDIDLSSHQSQGITLELVEYTDIFVTMTKAHSQILQKMYGVTSNKIRRIGNYLPKGKIFDAGIFPPIQKGDDIPDPMGESKEVVQPILDILELAAVSLAKDLKGIK